MSPDFRALSAAFNDRGVEFIIVEAHALAAHGLVRATRDLDVRVRSRPENAQRVLAALADFGAPLHGVSVDNLSRPGLVFQIGVEPLWIDVSTAVDGVDFAGAWSRRVPARFADQEAAVLSREHLLVNRRATGRDQDLLDGNGSRRTRTARAREDTRNTRYARLGAVADAGREGDRRRPS